MVEINALLQTDLFQKREDSIISDYDEVLRVGIFEQGIKWRDTVPTIDWVQSI